MDLGDRVDTQDLRVFLTVAELLHFGQAAKRLGLSQSRVSQIIRVLEDEIGGPLLERTSRKVELTDLGQRLRSSVARPLRDLRSALAGMAVDAGKVAGELKIGLVTPVAGGPFMPQIIEEFRQRYPDCIVKPFDMIFGCDPIDSLRRNEIELLAIRLPIDRDGLSVEPVLSCESRVLLVAKGHPLARCSTVTWDDVADYLVHDVPNFPQEAYRQLIPEYSPSGRPIRRALEARTFSEILLRVAQGDVIHPTVTSYSDHYSHPGVTAVPLDDHIPSRSGLVWSQATITPTGRAFINCARDIIAGRFDERDRSGPPIAAIS